MTSPIRLLCQIALLVSLWPVTPGISLAAGGGIWMQAPDTRGRLILDIDIFLPDPDSVFALSTDALLLSADEGSRWDSVAPGTCCGVLAVSPVNSERLFMNQTGIPFPGNALCESTDQGAHWSEITHGTCVAYPACAVHMFRLGPGSGNPLYASLNPYVLLRTTDHGVTWDSIMIPPSYGFWSLSLSHQNPEVMYIAYATPVRTYRTNDGGLSWEELPFPSIEEETAVFLAIDPRNHDVVYAAVRNNGLFKSSNGGQQWSLMNHGIQEENLSFNVITVNPHNPDEIFLGVADNNPFDGESDLVFASVDAGESWASLSDGLPVAGHVTDLVIDLRTFRILAGVNTQNDSVLSSGVYTLDPATVVPADQGLPSGSPRLLQNSPNPFNSETTIRFVLNSRADVTLSLHTLMGELAMVLVQRELEEGEHQILVDAGVLSTGVYFYTLEASGSRITRRMLLLR